MCRATDASVFGCWDWGLEKLADVSQGSSCIWAGLLTRSSSAHSAALTAAPNPTGARCTSWHSRLMAHKSPLPSVFLRAEWSAALQVREWGPCNKRSLLEALLCFLPTRRHTWRLHPRTFTESHWPSPSGCTCLYAAPSHPWPHVCFQRLEYNCGCTWPISLSSQHVPYFRSL